MAEIPNNNPQNQETQIPKVEYIVNQGIHQLWVRDIPLPIHQGSLQKNSSCDYVSLTIGVSDEDVPTAEGLLSYQEPGLRYSDELYPPQEGDPNRAIISAEDTQFALDILGDKSKAFLNHPNTFRDRWEDPTTEAWSNYELGGAISQRNTLDGVLKEVFGSRSGQHGMHPLFEQLSRDIANTDKPLLIIDAHGGARRKGFLWLKKTWSLGDDQSAMTVDASSFLHNLTQDKYSAIVIHACNGDRAPVEYEGATPIYFSNLDIGGRGENAAPNVTRIPPSK